VGLCDVAKLQIQVFQKTRSIGITSTEVYVTKPENHEHKNAYGFGVPVLHVNEDDSATSLHAAKKLMHGLTAGEVAKAVDEIGAK
jgi:hypothetical protein